MTYIAWAVVPSQMHADNEGEKEEKEELVVSAELAAIWPVITVGIVILIAIAASHRSMRRDMSELRRELNERIDRVQRELNERINGVQRELGARIDGVQQELGARIDVLSACLGDVRERLGRVEGLVEGIGFWQRQRDGGGQGDQESGPPKQ